MSVFESQVLPEVVAQKAAEALEEALRIAELAEGLRRRLDEIDAEIRALAGEQNTFSSHFDGAPAQRLVTLEEDSGLDDVVRVLSFTTWKLALPGHEAPQPMFGSVRELRDAIGL